MPGTPRGGPTTEPGATAPARPGETIPAEGCFGALLYIANLDAIAPDANPRPEFAVPELEDEADFACAFTADTELEVSDGVYNKVGMGLIADPTAEELNSTLGWVADQPGWEVNNEQVPGAGPEDGVIVTFTKVNPATEPTTPGEEVWVSGEQLVFASLNNETLGPEELEEIGDAAGVKIGPGAVMVVYAQGDLFQDSIAP